MNRNSSIDIRNKVMKQIEQEGIKPVPRWRFTLKRGLAFIAILSLALLVVLSISTITFTLHMDMFREYFSLGRTGLIDLLKTIPWLATAVILVTGWILRKLLIRDFANNSSIAVALSLSGILLLIGVGMGLKSPSNSLTSKLANVYRGGVEPVRIEGTIERVEGEIATLYLGDGRKVIIRYKDGTQFVSGKPELGDRILVLGFEKGDIVTAEYIKLQKKAEIKEDPKPIVKEQPKTVTTEPEPLKKTEAPKTQTATSPSPSPPAADPMLITLNNSGSTFKWKTNFVYDGGYKLVWSKNPGATYPGRNSQDTYIYNSNPVANPPQSSAVSAFDGPGLYYVRVCGLNAAHTCLKYSSEISISLP